MLNATDREELKSVFREAIEEFFADRVATNPPPITERQQEILDLTNASRTTGEIAKKLDITTSRVRQVKNQLIARGYLPSNPKSKH